MKTIQQFSLHYINQNFNFYFSQTQHGGQNVNGRIDDTHKMQRSESNKIISISNQNDELKKIKKQLLMNLEEQASTQISLNSRNSIGENSAQRSSSNQEINIPNMIYKYNLTDFNENQIINKQAQFENKPQYWLNQCQIIKKKLMKQYSKTEQHINKKFCHVLDYSLIYRWNLQAIKMSSLNEKLQKCSSLNSFLIYEPSGWPKYICSQCRQIIINFKDQLQSTINKFAKQSNKQMLMNVHYHVNCLQKIYFEEIQEIFKIETCHRSQEAAIKALLQQPFMDNNNMEKNDSDQKKLKSKLTDSKFDYLKKKMDLGGNLQFFYKQVTFDYRQCYESRQASEKLKHLNPQSRDYNLWKIYKNIYREHLSKYCKTKLEIKDIYKKIQNIFASEQIEKYRKDNEDLVQQNKYLTQKLQDLTQQLKQRNDSQRKEKRMMRQQFEKTDSNLKFSNKESGEKQQRSTFEKYEKEPKDTGCWNKFLQCIGYESKKEREGKYTIQQKQ